MSFNGKVTYPAAAYTTRTVLPSPRFAMLSWPDCCDEYGNVDMEATEHLKLRGPSREVMIPHIDLDDMARCQEFKCYDIKTGSNRTYFHKRLEDDEELCHVGMVVFDEYSQRGVDRRPFEGDSFTKLTCLIVATAGDEEHQPIMKLVGGDVERWVPYPGPRGYTTFGLVLAPLPGPDDGSGVAKGTEPSDKEAITEKQKSPWWKAKSKRSQSRAEDPQPETFSGPAVKYRRVGLFHGTKTSSRYFEDAPMNEFELV
ncbi:hypothetical protein B0T26DRAFT_710852 [Lasiosphaeria miniovina]|uniref:Uncharacterized protein n=1 Tax=Lasiosphaeria miniovina TaxID=1954250 RepID=A0AA40E030_9PEZI|nr:uncharacterized protein B0T26DRAFT_710852 [Lasiosphaeria miniovina]KAK0717783.1 hypothetical protein B0T26DRAFT_710852 [Lasiosphaeria miniovina]